MTVNTIKNILTDLPDSPGVYKFLNIKGEIIYVGKAKSLKNRVSSYFQSGILEGTKTYALVSRINDIQYIKVETELEALILESELIKKYRPKYNIIQKDDKSYLYIVFRKIAHNTGFREIKLTNIITARESDLLKNDVIFGPYPDGRSARDILRKVRLIYPFKDCSNTKYSRYKKINRPCLYGQLGLCSAPCVNYDENALAKYKESINGIKKILSGKSRSIISNLKRQMDKNSKSDDFESAIYYRDLLNKFVYISNSVRKPDNYIDNPYLVDDLSQKALEDIKNMIPLLTKIPKRIECYDISNISGTESVGSMVVATDGRINKNEYKRFKIKRKSSPDDFGMMQEVLERRLEHSKSDSKPFWDPPDLLLVDGGKGQVSVASAVVRKFGMNICVAGVAKKFEKIVYITNEGKFVEASYPKNTEGMKLIIRLRDESHRFAQSYHHLLRQKKLRKFTEEVSII